MAVYQKKIKHVRMYSFFDKLIKLAENICNKSKTIPKKLRECCSVTTDTNTRMATILRLKTQKRNDSLGKKLCALGFYELKHQKSPVTPNSILQCSLYFGGNFSFSLDLHCLPKNLQIEVTSHKVFRFVRANYLRDYPTPYCNS